MRSSGLMLIILMSLFGIKAWISEWRLFKKYNCWNVDQKVKQFWFRTHQYTYIFFFMLYLSQSNSCMSANDTKPFMVAAGYARQILPAINTYTCSCSLKKSSLCYSRTGQCSYHSCTNNIGFPSDVTMFGSITNVPTDQVCTKRRIKAFVQRPERQL